MKHANGQEQLAHYEFYVYLYINKEVKCLPLPLGLPAEDVS
jgi:hypothetical protein